LIYVWRHIQQFWHYLFQRDKDSAMSESNASATIIQFPRPASLESAAPVEAEPVSAQAVPDPAQRLRRALTLLDVALAEQRTAVADWRGALSELNTSVQDLGRSLRRYPKSLDPLQDQITR
jgi:hypothetical protein